HRHSQHSGEVLTDRVNVLFVAMDELYFVASSNSTKTPKRAKKRKRGSLARKRQRHFVSRNAARDSPFVEHPGLVRYQNWLKSSSRQVLKPTFRWHRRARPAGKRCIGEVQDSHDAITRAADSGGCAAPMGSQPIFDCIQSQDCSPPRNSSMAFRASS